MTNMLTRKLQLFGPLGDGDKALLDVVCRPSRTLAAGARITAEGDNPTHVHLILEGLACRSKLMPEGRRHISAFLIPGDFCDLNIFILKTMDHDIETISPSRVVDIPRDTILALCNRPDIVRALWWATLVDEATLRDWLVNLGEREAEERIAHLLCELHLRMSSVGLTDGGKFSLPISQTTLGEAMGITPVHVNRSLQALRAQKLIEFKSRVVDIHDIARLRDFSGFDPNYLHLDGGKKDAQIF